MLTPPLPPPLLCQVMSLWTHFRSISATDVDDGVIDRRDGTSSAFGAGDPNKMSPEIINTIQRLMRKRQQPIRLAAWREVACPAWIPAVFAVIIAMLAAPRLLGVV